MGSCSHNYRNLLIMIALSKWILCMNFHRFCAFFSIHNGNNSNDSMKNVDENFQQCDNGLFMYHFPLILEFSDVIHVKILIVSSIIIVCWLYIFYVRYSLYGLLKLLLLYFLHGFSPFHIEWTFRRNDEGIKKGILVIKPT